MQGPWEGAVLRELRDQAMTPHSTAGVETELKFELDPDAVLKLREHPAFAAGEPARRLRSVYFDTPDHDLKNRGLTLRVREVADGYVQTVKQRQNGLFGRDEWEQQVAAERPDPHAFHDTPVENLLNGDAARLAPVFATTVDRCVHMWRQGEDVVEISLDQGEIAAGEQREPIRELELELKAGRPEALFNLARELAHDAPMRLSFESKGERGYRLAGHDGLAALKAEQTAVTPDLPAEDAFRVVARSALAQVTGNAQLLRRARLPEAVHQMRVGLRRFRAALSAFKPILDGKGFAEVKAGTKWLAKTLDEARDIDVFIQDTFRPAEAAAGEGDPDLEALGAKLRQVQAEAYEHVAKALESPKFAELLLEVAAWVEVGNWGRAENPARQERASEFGARVLDRLHKRVRRKGLKLDELSVEARHKLRIEAKKLRYAADFFGSAFPRRRDDRRERYRVAVRTLQDRLGELNDVAVARTKGPKLLGGRPNQIVFTAGLIVGRREQGAAKLLKASESAFDDFRDAKPFWRG
jgi:triphosphatase